MLAFNWINLEGKQNKLNYIRTEQNYIYLILLYTIRMIMGPTFVISR